MLLCDAFQFKYMKRLLKQISCFRSGWERRAIALAHITNTLTVCRTRKTLYDEQMVAHIHSFSTINYT